MTPRPTLSEEQAWADAYARLRPQDDCRFPCWWGLRPEETTVEEALDFYRHLGYEQQYPAPTEEAHFPFEFHLPNGPIGDKFSFLIYTRVRDQAVWMIEVSAMRGESDMFYQYMEPYSIEQVIAMYGKPDRVWIRPPSYYGGDPIRRDGGNYPFGIWLFYDAVGAVLTYHGEPSFFFDAGKQVRICPQLRDKRVEDISIYLRSPADKSHLTKFIQRYSSAKDLLFPLEEISRLTIDDFTAAVTEAEPACFDVEVR